MPPENIETVEAVLLFKGNSITREMLYPEFEAILDGFVPVPDFKNGSAKAVYLVINANLCVTAAVFFLLDFDEKGIIDRRWNIPLQHLAEISGKGPDLGAGPIRLACFSQCAMEFQQNKLWDPHMEPSQNSFLSIKKAIHTNRLGLVFKPATQTPENLSTESSNSNIHHLVLQQKLQAQFSQELRDRLAGELKSQRLRVATLHAKHLESIKKIQHEHQQRLKAYQDKLIAAEAINADLNNRNNNLKESVDIQAKKMEGIREYFSHKLKAAQFDENTQTHAMQENFNLELELKIQTATAELREMLDMREVELFYRHQNESNLKEEIVNLKNECQALLNNSGEQVLTRLNKAGVNFVAYHPGAGQFSIALDDLSRYLENPISVVAKKTGVSEAIYAHWFSHYQNPSCNNSNEDGSICNKALVRIGSPLEFHEGESDRCEDHQMLQFSLAANTHS